MILLAWALAFAAPEDALDEVSRQFYLQALTAESERRWPEAESLHRLVLGKDPAFVPALLGVGRALEARGEDAEAEALYRSAPSDVDVVEALARLLTRRGSSEALSAWLRVQGLNPGYPASYQEETRLRLPADLDGALAAWTRYRALSRGEEPDGATLLALGSALREAGRVGDAEALWKAYLEEAPEGAVAVEVKARLDRLDLERAAEALSLGGSEPLPDRLRSVQVAGQAAMAAGDLEAAEARARELVAAAPRTAEAHALLAEVLVAREAWEEGEIHAVLAATLAPDEAQNRVRLGLLLYEAYGGRRDHEAAEELREAAVLRPADAEVLAALGRAEQRVGSWDAAIAAFEGALRAGASPETAADLEKRLDGLRRAPPPAPDLPAAPSARLPAPAESHYRLALELGRRGRYTEAIVELEAALAVAPSSPVLLNKRARLARQAGAPGEAESWLARSLAVEPSQPAVRMELGDLARARGDLAAAEARYGEAAAEGSAEAHYQLARIAEARGDWGFVRAQLDAYEEAAPGSGSLYAAGARELRARADHRLLLLRLGMASGALVVFGIPLFAWLRWRTARTLRDLLDGAPESWHDAARLLAALRHEVLKHNTTVLPDVAEALNRGDTGPWEAFSGRAPELLRHFRRYLADLEALGRRHGMRLGLRGRDPILGPMHRAMVRLARIRRPRADELLALSEAVNGRGYAAIGAIVQEICVLPVRVDGVRAVYARVSTEPGFAGTTVPSLDVAAREEGLAVRMFRADLDDILANLLRNALAAGANTLAVELGAYDDPVTGHAWVEVAVVDDAPGTLTNAMIRGRYIGRGLGLAVDLINRHGGSIRVEGRGDGRKAVVVQLPSVEAAPVEAEWTVA